MLKWVGHLQACSVMRQEPLVTGCSWLIPYNCVTHIVARRAATTSGVFDKQPMPGRQVDALLPICRLCAPVATGVVGPLVEKLDVSCWPAAGMFLVCVLCCSLG